VFSEDPARLAGWYRDKLGLAFEGSEEFGAFYQVFWGLDPDDPAKRLDTTFAIMRSRVPLPARDTDDEPEEMYGDQPFMLNLRVNDLDALLGELEKLGIKVISRQDEEYGSFAWIRDADGNRVELYQPAPSK
jgi:catechol 2,3-dioxygenase-like lactoylglutathione lyase family enzyme